jgi:uncharacterized membrane protein (DUF485 family)
MGTWVTVGVVLGFVVLVIATVVKWVWYWHLRRRFEGESPVTERWRADHEYRRDGDDRQWK